MEFYQSTLKEVFSRLKRSKEGLTQEEAEIRLKEYGYNEIKGKHTIFPVKIFLSQFKNFIVIILIIAAVIAALIPVVEKGYNNINLWDMKDSIVISIILFLNAIFGFIQEYKAEKAIEALKKLASPKAKVIRNKKEYEIPARELVPGDIIILDEGDKISADARLIKTINLEVQESTLTGESMPVEKKIGVLKDKGLAERSNMIFSGTIVTRGKALAVVVKTGMETEIGKIASLIQQTKEGPTPLQKKLSQLGKFIGILVLVISAIVFGVGVLSGIEILDMFIRAVSLAVAAVPEGLPAVVTISLAIAVQRMVKKNALVRKLHSVETLGSTNVICADKTGTLTHNKMTVTKLYANKKIISVGGQGYSREGKFSQNPKNFELLLQIGTLCNDSKVNFEKEEIIGDPTEAALIVSAAKAGIDREEIEKEHPRLEEIPFSSERKLMTTVHEIKGSRYAYTKGAPDIVLEKCNKVYENGKIKKLTKKDKESILKVNDNFAKDALRVLGFAFKKLDKKLDEKDLVFVGLQAMIDPPREDAIQAIKAAKLAGIRVMMITGDQELTAKAIAKQLNITGNSITGQELKDEEIENVIDDISIYSRVTPKQKMDIVEALQKKDKIVAMTGDGVNDAPALKKADIGIAVGSGTDVAKEASNMIITDDNFASIVNAIKEGRIIYDNIRKFVFYLLSSNMGEVLTIFLAILVAGIFGWYNNGILILPLLAIHILWINLVTDGLPALALSIEPEEPGIMERKPRDKKERILSTSLFLRMFLIGLIMTLGTLFLFDKYSPDINPMKAQTVAFTTLMMFQMFNVINSRSHDKSIFKIGFFSNKYLIGAIAISIILHLSIIYTSFGASVFETTFLSAIDWLYIIAVSSSVLIFGEIYKIARFRLRKA